MYNFFRSRYERYKQTTYSINPVRWVEFGLCFACFVFTLVMIILPFTITFTVSISLMVISIAFAIITLTDMISNSLYNPMYWNTWIVFAMAGALFFFVCVGLLLALITSMAGVLFIATVVNGVTAIIFLLDALLIMNLTRQKLHAVFPESATPPITKGRGRKTPPQTASQDVYLDVQDSRRTVRDDTDTSQSSFVRRNVSCECDARQGTPSSYGGTFPMGRDAVPLPSPSPSPTSSRSTIDRTKSSPLKLSGSKTVTASSKVQKRQDGATVLADGTPLHEELLDTGDIGYRDHRGVIYTKNGLPIAPVKSRQKMASNSAVFKDGAYYTQDGRKFPPVRMDNQGKVVGVDGTPFEEISVGKGMIVFQSPDGFLYTPEGVPYGYNAGFQQDAPHYAEEKKFLVPRRSVETFRTQEVIRTVEFRPECQFFTPENVPLIEIQSPSGTRMYQGPEGEMYHADKRGVVLCRNHPGYQNATPGSRTVAISTRMVPKGAKADDKPKMMKMSEVPSGGPPVYPLRQHQPTAVSQQYFSKPCTCGKMHYQELSTVQGVYRSGGPPHELRPPGVYGMGVCQCCATQEIKAPGMGMGGCQCYPTRPRTPAPPPSEQQEREHTPLSTISEVEVEMDSTPASSRAGRQRPADHPGAVAHPAKSGEVQTSETRIVRATDVQKMNASLAAANRRI